MMTDKIKLLQPFAYVAVVRMHRCRHPIAKVYRSIDQVEIRSVHASHVETAFTVELGPDRSFDVLSCNGELYWPLRSSDPFKQAFDPEPLTAVARGDLALFDGSELHDDIRSLDDDVWVASVIENLRTIAITEMRRKALRCIAIEGRLFATGGVPLPIRIGSRWLVANPGATRNAVVTDELALEPGGFRSTRVRTALAEGRFRIPEDGPHDGAAYPRIAVHRTHCVNRVDVRVDALFRLLSRRIEPPRLPEHHRALWRAYARCDAAMAEGRQDLTAARCTALNFLRSKAPSMLSPHDHRLLAAVLHAVAAAREGHFRHRSDVELAPEEEIALEQLRVTA